MVHKLHICNITFPIVKGGLGIQSGVDLCLPGFLSSCYGISEMVMSLLSPAVFHDSPFLRLSNKWSSKCI